ncbi:MAG: hypothetical protein AB7P02_12695 [Alphaproteobacteria bacterium]
MFTAGWKPGAHARPGGGAPWLAKITEGQPIEWVRGKPDAELRATDWPTLEPGHYSAGNAQRAIFAGSLDAITPADGRVYFVVENGRAVPCGQGRTRPDDFPAPAAGPGGTRFRRRGRGSPTPTPTEDPRLRDELNAARERWDQAMIHCADLDRRAVEAARAIGAAVDALDSLDIPADRLAAITEHLDRAADALRGE